MTTEPTAVRGSRALVRRLRWIHLAPVLALIALLAWAFASPIGAGPDDDYHLVSTWCANGGSEQCQEAADETERNLPVVYRDIACYAQHGDRSGACQYIVLEKTERYETARGNYHSNEYPPVYYAVMRIFAGDDIQLSALVMRVLNAVLFVALATALFALLPLWRRSTLLWGWLVTTIPLGIFLIPSNNPSGWALTGVGTAFLALLGWFETTGRRRWALGAIYVVGLLMAAGSRGDAAVYVAGASLTAMILTSARTKDWALRAILPLAGILVAFLFFAGAGQSGVAGVGFTSGGPLEVDPVTGEARTPITGFALVAYNLLMLPHLWTGVWGTWGLGWFDTTLPYLVPWAAASAFIVVAFAGIGRISWRKAIASAGVLLVLIALPIYVLSVGGHRVGEMLQPRYLLPLIVLFAFLLLTVPSGRELRFTRLQTFAVLGALAIANFVSLQVNIRRYVTGDDQQGLSLDAGAEWWWTGFPVGPNVVWIVGSLAFAGLLVVLWPELRRASTAPAVPPLFERAGSVRGGD